MDVTEIKKLMEVLNSTDVTEISLEADDAKVLLKKAQNIRKVAVQVPVAQTTPIVEVSKDKGLISLNVGRFYFKDDNGKAIIQEGDEIKDGQIVGFIESVGVKTEVRSDINGIIKEIKLENGERTEFGKVLMMVKER